MLAQETLRARYSDHMLECLQLPHYEITECVNNEYFIRATWFCPTVSSRRIQSTTILFSSVPYGSSLTTVPSTYPRQHTEEDML